jgi:hypothetical protein
MSYWDEIDEKVYLPFAKFEEYGDKLELYCQLVDSEPSIFKNRWGKEQWSITVWCYRPKSKGYPELITTGTQDDKHILVGGTRLFSILKKEKDYDGILRIRRHGEGFKTNYSIVQKIKIKK